MFNEKIAWEKLCKDLGLKIRHVRNEDEIQHTVVYRDNKDGTITFGKAVVHPNDKPNKEIGRKIAFNRMRFSYKTEIQKGDLYGTVPNFVFYNDILY